jgi:hypothetical protein
MKLRVIFSFITFYFFLSLFFPSLANPDEGIMFMNGSAFLTGELKHEYNKMYLNMLLAMALLYCPKWICGIIDLIINLLHKRL